jgi:benzodiazapine receptor
MKQFLGFAAIVFAAAAFGSMFSPDAWFSHQRKPSWQPPDWLFGPVWTALYTFIAIAGWLVYRRVEFGLPLAVWLIQLILNAVWSWLFFGIHRPDLALIDMGLLLVAIVACIVLFSRVSFTATALMVPYALWVAYAMSLNFAFWRLNRVP